MRTELSTSKQSLSNESTEAGSPSSLTFSYHVVSYWNKAAALTRLLRRQGGLVLQTRPTLLPIYTFNHVFPMIGVAETTRSAQYHGLYGLCRPIGTSQISYSERPIAAENVTTGNRVDPRPGHVSDSVSTAIRGITPRISCTMFWTRNSYRCPSLILGYDVHWMPCHMLEWFDVTFLVFLGTHRSLPRPFRHVSGSL